MLSVIVTVGSDGAIGGGPGDRWRIAGDDDGAGWFAEAVRGRPAIVGAHAWPALRAALPGSPVCVISRRGGAAAAAGAAALARSPGEALRWALARDDEVVVLGGLYVFDQFWPLAERAFRTVVEAEVPAAGAVRLRRYAAAPGEDDDGDGWRRAAVESARVLARWGDAGDLREVTVRREVLVRPGAGIAPSVVGLAGFARRCAATAAFPGRGEGTPYPRLGLFGEAGEALGEALARFGPGAGPAPLAERLMRLGRAAGRACEHLKKVDRNDGGRLTPARRSALRDTIAAAAEVAVEALEQLEAHPEDRPLTLGRMAPPGPDAPGGGEIRDAAWYVALAAAEDGVALPDLAASLLKKLEGRAARGTIAGDGEVR